MERSPADVYADHCRRHELAFQLDVDGGALFRPRVGHDTWRVSAGRGAVYATTVVRPRGGDPYNVALIDLDEGFRMMSRVVGCVAERVTIGMRVRLAWADPEAESLPPVPVFAPEAP